MTTILTTQSDVELHSGLLLSPPPPRPGRNVWIMNMFNTDSDDDTTEESKLKAFGASEYHPLFAN